MSGVCTAGTAKYWQYLVRLVLRVLRIHGVVPKYSHYAEYTGSMKYIWTIYLCTAVSIISSAFYCRQHALVPRIGVETKCFRGGTRVLRALAVFREYMLRALEISTGSISEHSNHFGCLCCGYCLFYSGFCTTHHTPSTRSIWAFSTRTAHTPSTRSI